jgi:membrane protein DedA with SNARE-associated domain
MMDVLAALAAMPPALLYLVIAVGAALENVIPPIPADTAVLLGAVLAAAGRASPRLVFFWTWSANVAGLVFVYVLARRYGHRFFGTAAGRRLLHPAQLEQIARFYARWGWPAIFVSRFLPGLRGVVPVFAGVSHVPAWQVIAPAAMASAIWYGFLVHVGAATGRNLDAILEIVQRTGAVLLIIAVLLMAGIVYWWWRSRRG